MSLARLSGGPLDGQVIPLEDATEDSLIVPYSEGQVVYRRDRDADGADDNDGPSQALFVYVEATQEIIPGDDDVRPGE